MDKFKQYVKKFLSDESGAEMMEYVIVLVAAIGAIVFIMAISKTTTGTMEDVNKFAGDEFENALKDAGWKG